MALDDLTDRERGLRVLACPLVHPEDNVDTVGDWLIEALWELWTEVERFDGKRPLGNSGWEDMLHHSLVKGGVIPGQWDAENQAAWEYDEDLANDLIYYAIDALRPLPAPSVSPAMPVETRSPKPETRPPEESHE